MLRNQTLDPESTVLSQSPEVHFGMCSVCLVWGDTIFVWVLSFECTPAPSVQHTRLPFYWVPHGGTRIFVGHLLRINSTHFVRQTRVTTAALGSTLARHPRKYNLEPNVSLRAFSNVP